MGQSSLRPAAGVAEWLLRRLPAVEWLTLELRDDIATSVESQQSLPEWKWIELQMAAPRLRALSLRNVAARWSAVM